MKTKIIPRLLFLLVLTLLGQKSFAQVHLDYFSFIDGRFMFDGEERFVGTRLYDTETGSKRILEWQFMNKELEIETCYSPEPNMRVVIRERRNTTTGEWEGIDRDTSYVEALLMSPPSKWRGSIYPDDAFGNLALMTQTLFNSDENYEFFRPILDHEVVVYSEDYLSRYRYVNGLVTAYEIVDEHGTILCTLHADEGRFFHDICYVYNICGKDYLMIPIGDMSFSNVMYDNFNSFRYYEINRETNSIDFVCEVKDKMRVSPTVADKDDVITVTLNTPKENAQMIVSSVSGQMVKRYTLSNDDKYITLDAATLRSGVYCISLHKNGAVIDSEKIIIK